MKRTLIGYFLASKHASVDAGGVAPYSFRVLDLLLKPGFGRDFCLMVSRHQVEEIKDWLNTSGLTAAKIQVVPESNALLKLNRAFLRIVMRTDGRFAASVLSALNPINRQATKAGLSQIHFPLQHLPAFGWTLPVIGTVHDLQELHLPEFFDSRIRASRNRLNRASMCAAARIVVSYEHVRADIQRFYPEYAPKVCVCPIPVDAGWLRPNSYNDNDLKLPYGLNEPFLLYPAQTWRHKNHLGLIRAMAILKATGMPVPLVVCTGRLNEFFPAIQQAVKNADLVDRIRFLGVVSEADLRRLYMQCRIVVVPTLYEAGSFPVMEAMLLHAPVICSNVTSLPETIGDTEFVFNPTDAEDIARILRLGAFDDDFIKRCRQNSESQRSRMLGSRHVAEIAFRRLYQSTVD